MISKPLYSEEMAAAERAAREAGSIVMSMFKGKFDVQEKARITLSPRPILRPTAKFDIIQEKFPRMADFGRRQGQFSTVGLSRIWIVDPIDGTKEFIEGVPSSRFLSVLSSTGGRK